MKALFSLVYFLLLPTKFWDRNSDPHLYELVDVYVLNLAEENRGTGRGN